VLGGKLCWNVMPRGASKGEALARYWEARASRPARLVYFGDEPTDETVFARADLPVIGVRVGGGPTAARYRVPDIAAVHAWVRELADLVAK
jgi:trehalose 6-phosphate phosphatase